MLLCYVIDSGLSTSLLLLATLIIMFYIYITYTGNCQLHLQQTIASLWSTLSESAVRKDADSATMYVGASILWRICFGMHLEALHNALYKLKTYILTYFFDDIIITGIDTVGLIYDLNKENWRRFSFSNCVYSVLCRGPQLWFHHDVTGHLVQSINRW